MRAIDQDIINEFCDEAQKLFNELEGLLSVMEDNPLVTTNYEKFGQIIDRVMGAAKSIGQEDIANFCELGKIIGYKSSQINDGKLLNITVAVLFDAIYLLQKMIHHLVTGNANVMEGLNTKAFGTRLKWLSEKYKHIERGSCAFDDQDDGGDNLELSQDKINELMSSLGL